MFALAKAFTFQSGDIQIVQTGTLRGSWTIFTFQSGDIQIISELKANAFVEFDLHSNLVIFK